ncbi:MAG: DJ-1/PfpI family protein [Alphaproteobacteria bacterium CG_4_9_14_3_um_filter_47_13]|nr:MAG: DJ-1/PfpI family protein [Alphaproteobacteria bacterium CG_4_9_14_3_um_filter_47_13]
MNKHLFGVKAAMLVANGFSQNDMIAAQKALLNEGANVRIVSPENGLVNGWDGQTWGHHFAVDTPLSTALASDFSILVIPGGQRSMEKMNLTAHTKRFINSFMDSGKPVIVMDSALRIMILTDHIKGHNIGGPADMADIVMQAGANWIGQEVCIDGNLMTGEMGEQNLQTFVTAMVDHIGNCMDTEQAA